MRSREGLPQGALIGAIEIHNEAETENLSLHIKLQRAMSRRRTLSKAALESERLGKLKAPEGLSAEDFMVTPPSRPQ